MTAHDWVFAILGIIAWEIAGQITDRFLWPAFLKIRSWIKMRLILRRMLRYQRNSFGNFDPPPAHFNCRCVIIPIEKDEM